MLIFREQFFLSDEFAVFVDVGVLDFKRHNLVPEQAASVARAAF